MSNLLGIYFGSKVVSLVESKGKKVLNSLLIQRSALTATGLEETVPEEVKIVALFKDELRRNKIDAKEAFLSLSGKDLIIRTFEMPPLPSGELINAVNFEAKKYIPFKVEDLVSDFHSFFDRSIQKNLILFVGIKKEILDRYISILKQLNIKVNCIEYSAFSVLRFLRLVGTGNRGVSAVIAADLEEETEVNFTVLQNGFPLFSRDISLATGQEELPRTESTSRSAMLEKLKTEIRISLDYYHRKLPTKKIGKVFLLCEEDYRLDLQSFLRDLAFSTQFVEVKKQVYLGKAQAFSLSAIKAFGCSFSKRIKIPFKIDLLTVQAKLKVAKEAVARERVSILSGLRPAPIVIILGFLVCMGVLMFGLYKKFPLQKKLDEIIESRPKVSTVDPEFSNEQLFAIDSDYKNRIEVINEVINKPTYITKLLDSLPRIVPDDMWLTNFSFSKRERGTEVMLYGATYLADTQKEIELVNTFVSHLKTDAVFGKYFKDIAVITIDKINLIGDINVTNFVISCVISYKEE